MKRSAFKRNAPLQQTAPPPRKSPVGRASQAQRVKVRGSACRVCGGLNVDPAHVTPRGSAHGSGCDEPDCVIPLCRSCHRTFDEGSVEVLPALTREEQAHAVLHSGLLGALRRTTGLYWVPAKESE